MRECTNVLEGVPDIASELPQQRLRGRRILLGELAGDAEVHGERDQLLLRAVVDVALDAAPLGVGGRDDAAA